MYSTEKVFIMKFIACLQKMGVENIPYDNANFYKGAENMQDYFLKNRNQLGARSNELAMLFLKNPLSGKFAEFKEGIEQQNGGLMTFDNPNYVKATIELDESGADYILGQDNIDIPKEMLFQFSKAFCKGAEIPCEGNFQ